MKIKTERRCGCRDEDGRKYPRGKCPELAAKRTHGTWSYRFRVPKELVPLVGKSEISDSGYATKKKAEEEAEKAVARVHTGRQHIGGLTVGDYLRDWHSRKNALRPTTRARYEQFIRLHLVPFLGDMPLAGLRSEHIDSALKLAVATSQAPERRPRRPIGPATVADVLEMLRTALNDALRQRKIDFNPALGVELASYATPEVEPWEAEEVGRFLDEAASDRLAAAYELMALHGLRRGEVCGATWTALDEEDRVLVIRKQITRSGSVMGVWEPKTKAGRRKVDLAEVVLGSLAIHRLHQDEERAAVGVDRWDNGILPDEHGNPVQLEDLIFTHPSGRHLAPEYLTRQMQRIARRVGLLSNVRDAAPKGSTTIVVGKRYRQAEGTWTLYRDRAPIGEVTVLGVGGGLSGSRALLRLTAPLSVDLAIGDELGDRLLSPKRLHDLRHGSVTIMLDNNVNEVIVSKVVGHSSTTVTGNLYAHKLKSTGRAAAETIAAAIPREIRRGHPVGTSAGDGGGIGKAGSVSPGQGPVRRGQAPSSGVEVAGIEPASSGPDTGLLRAHPATCFSASSDTQASQHRLSRCLMSRPTPRPGQPVILLATSDSGPEALPD